MRTDSFQSVSYRSPVASFECVTEKPIMNNTTSRVRTSNKFGVTAPASGRCPSSHCSRGGQAAQYGIFYRNLGRSGLKVPNIGFGTWTIFCGGAGSEQAESVLVAAYEAGINLFDLTGPTCSDVCEIELGKILKKKGWSRSSYIIVCKIYWAPNTGLSRKLIIESVRSSLLRLQLDYIDVVLINRVDPMCSMEEIIRATTFVITQGWVMYWGTCRWSGYEIRNAFTLCRQFQCITPVVDQVEYHMFFREHGEITSQELFSTIGTGVIAWSNITLGRMFNDFPHVMHSLQRRGIQCTWSEEENTFGTVEILSWYKESTCDNNDVDLEKLRTIAQIAKRLDCSLTQFCIAWCLKNELVQCLILGASTIQQLSHSLYSLQVVPRLNASIIEEVENTLANKPKRGPIVSTLALR